jgi:hypothetical protein
MRLGATERRQSERGEIVLQVGQVALARGKIEGEVLRAVAEFRALDFRFPGREETRRVGIDFTHALAKQGATRADAGGLVRLAGPVTAGLASWDVCHWIASMRFPAFGHAASGPGLRPEG